MRDPLSNICETPSRSQYPSCNLMRNRVTLGLMAKKKMPAEVLEYFRKEGQKGGKIGGKKRTEALTPEERSASAANAAKARWAKAKKKPTA